MTPDDSTTSPRVNPLHEEIDHKGGTTSKGTVNREGAPKEAATSSNGQPRTNTETTGVETPPLPRVGGLGGSDRKGKNIGGPEEKRGALHADQVGRRI